MPEDTTPTVSPSSVPAKTPVNPSGIDNHAQNPSGNSPEQINQPSTQSVAPISTPTPVIAKNPEQRRSDQKAMDSLVGKMQQALNISQPQKKESVDRKEVLEAERIYQESITSIKDLIAPSSMKVGYDKIQLSGLYLMSFFVFAYPRYVDVNWLGDIINFDITMDISMFIYPIESVAIMKNLRNKAGQVSSSISINQEKGNVRDPELETALGDIEELRDGLQRGEQKSFQFGLYFTIYHEQEDMLAKFAKQLEAILGGQLVFTKRTAMRSEQGFNSCLPYSTDELDVTEYLNTDPLSTTFPFISNELTSENGILYGVNTYNNTLVIFDRFSLENPNCVVFATAGAGKSFAVKLEILRSIMMGTDVLVIDPEHEYKILCNALGGTYINMSLNSKERINPFDLPVPIADQSENPTDLLRSAIITLASLLRLMLGELTPAEEAILDQALIDTYAIKGITMETKEPHLISPPTMEDLHDVLSSTKGGEVLAQRLGRYTHGTFGGIFNKSTNVNLTKRFLCFSVRDLEDELRPIAMFIILNFIWTHIRSKLKRRILVIDEAWFMMKHEDSANFLESLVKRSRKYYLGITTITQDVGDFLNSPHGKPIITNSAMQILLKQSPAAIKTVSETFNLTEREEYLLLESDIGHGLFFAGIKHVPIYITAFRKEEKLITTKPEELIKMQEDEAAKKTK